MTHLQKKYDSPVGPIYLVASETHLQGVFWRSTALPVWKDLVNTQSQQQIFKKTELQLNEYFNGVRKQFDLPIQSQGTTFQNRVWKQLSKIPYGQTVSYKDIAAKIDSAKSFRAVGTANGRNPLSIIVPCHRVIAADGTLGGYAGGLDIKTKLIQLEQDGCL